MSIEIEQMRFLLAQNTQKFYVYVQQRTKLYMQIQVLEREIYETDLYIESVSTRENRKNKQIREEVVDAKQYKRELMKQINVLKDELHSIERFIETYMSWIDELNQLELENLSD